ncbi:uncharacterized protein LOC111126430 isoform X1 [Crassostrea virginica]
MSGIREVITETERCREVVSILSRENVLALACQIIEQGFHDRLSLLQLGTLGGDVYLFDIQENMDLIAKGGLCSLLDSCEIEKVTKRCKNYSYILHHQFNVCLQNVFDVKVADDILEEQKGRLIFQNLTLQDLCKKHSTDGSLTAESVDEYKMQKYASKVHLGERPLSEEMVDYYARDVIDLIPVLYRKLKDYIGQNNLKKRLLEETTDRLNECKDRKLKEKRGKNRQDCIWQVITSIDEKWDKSTKCSDFATNSEEILALRLIPYWKALQKSPFIGRLKTESILCYLDQLDNYVKTEKEEYQVTKYHWDSLSMILKHPDKKVSNQAKDLKKRMKAIALKRMENIYSIHTNLENLKTIELRILRTLRLRSTNDCQFSPVVARLFWLFMENNLDYKREEFEKWGKVFKRSDPFYRKISFYAERTDESQIPKSVRQKSKSLKRDYDLSVE